MKLKITALTAAILCFVCYANSQTIEKGKNFINGSISFNKSRNEPLSQSSSSFATNDNSGALFNFKYGKFISDNSVLGILGIYGQTKNVTRTTFYNSANNSQSFYSTNNTAKTLGGGIFYRKYFEIANRFYFYGEANAFYSNSKIKTIISSAFPTTNDTTRQNNFSVGVAPGLTYRVFKNLHLDANLPNVANVFYTSTKNRVMGKSESYGFQTSLSSQLLQNTSLGLLLVF